MSLKNALHILDYMYCVFVADSTDTGTAVSTRVYATHFTACRCWRSAPTAESSYATAASSVLPWQAVVESKRGFLNAAKKVELAVEPNVSGASVVGLAPHGARARESSEVASRT